MEQSVQSLVKDDRLHFVVIFRRYERRRRKKITRTQFHESPHNFVPAGQKLRQTTSRKKTCKEKPSLDSKESRRQRKLWFAKEVTWRNTCFRYFITKCVILSAKEVTGISERTGNQDHLSSTCRSEFRLLFQGRFFFGRFFAKGQSLRSHNTKHINESRKKTDANTMAWQELSTELSIIERQVNTRDACMQVLQKRGIQEFLCIKKTAGICVAQKAKLKEMQVTISVSDWLECKNKASVSWMLF